MRQILTSCLPVTLLLFVQFMHFSTLMSANNNENGMRNHAITTLHREYTSSLFWKSSSSSSSQSQGSCMPVSLVLFGVPKHFSHVWTHYLEHIVRPNPHVQFELHMHMYSDLSNFTNPKNNEINVTTETPSDIQSILISKTRGVI